MAFVRGVLQNFIKTIDIYRLVRWSAVGGALALLVALIIYLVEGEITATAFVAIGLGVAGLGVWVLVAPQELSDWLSGRQVYFGTGSILLSIIVVGVAVAGYSAIERRDQVFDLTAYSLYTLDSTSLEAIDSLKSRLVGTEFKARIVGFYPRDEQREQDAAEILLKQFEAEGDGYIEVQFVNPDEEPLLANQYGYGVDAGGQLAGPLFLTYVNADGERVQGGFEVIGEPNERNIATAMQRLSIAGQLTVYFTAGHLEYPTTAQGDFGISVIFGALQNLGINAEVLDLSLVESIPEDADALVIAGPQLDFDERDVAKIDAYIQQGGRILITGDPPYVDNYQLEVNNEFLLNDSPFSQYLWNEFGVRMRVDLVSDVASSVSSELNLLIQRISGVQEITLNFPRAPIVLSLARSIEAVSVPEAGTNQALYQREAFLFTSDEGYGERGSPVTEGGAPTLLGLLTGNPIYDEGVDTAGPLIMGLAVRKFDESQTAIKPRVVFLGDTDWLTNGSVRPTDSASTLTGNLILWGRIIEWLLNSAELSVPEAQIRLDLLPVTVSDAQQTRIWLITLGLLPGMVLGIGIIVWGIRQRR